jgi:hypothetical protein
MRVLPLVVCVLMYDRRVALATVAHAMLFVIAGTV